MTCCGVDWPTETTASRSRYQGLSLGDRAVSFTAGLPELPRLVDSGEQTAQQVAELLPLVDRQPGPGEGRARGQGRHLEAGQARGEQWDERRCAFDGSRPFRQKLLARCGELKQRREADGSRACRLRTTFALRCSAGGPSPG